MDASPQEVTRCFERMVFAVTLNELIEAAFELREEVGGDAPVLMLTAQGYATVLMSDALGFSSEDGDGPAPVVLVVPARAN